MVFVARISTIDRIVVRKNTLAFITSPQLATVFFQDIVNTVTVCKIWKKISLYAVNDAPCNVWFFVQYALQTILRVDLIPFVLLSFQALWCQGWNGSYLLLFLCSILLLWQIFLHHQLFL